MEAHNLNSWAAKNPISFFQVLRSPRSGSNILVQVGQDGLVGMELVGWLYSDYNTNLHSTSNWN